VSKHLPVFNLDIDHFTKIIDTYGHLEVTSVKKAWQLLIVRVEKKIFVSRFW